MLGPVSNGFEMPLFWKLHIKPYQIGAMTLDGVTVFVVGRAGEFGGPLDWEHMVGSAVSFMGQTMNLRNILELLLQ